MTYKVGIAGAGSFGVAAHIPSFVAHPEFDIIAVASPNSAQRVASERQIPHAFSTVEDMVALPEIDVVAIASPPFAHHDAVLTALAAGKHVICEKPFALNVAQAQAMVDAAKKAGTACAVMHEFRWVPQRYALRELIANNHVSPLREIEVTQLMGFLRQSGTRADSWWFDKARGGGLAGALLSHLIDCATWLAGRYPVKSTGFIRTANPQRTDANGNRFTSTVDDGAFALLDYGDGLIARVSADATLGVEQMTVGAHSETRTAISSGPDMVQQRLFAVDEDETAELECKPLAHARFEAVQPNVPLIMALLDEFVKQIETGTSAVPTFEDALHTQRVLESIGYSA